MLNIFHDWHGVDPYHPPRQSFFKKIEKKICAAQKDCIHTLYLCSVKQKGTLADVV